MSGKPAARQGDMTQYGGPIVQGSAGVRIGAPTGVACSVCPGGMTSGNPVNPLLGAKVLPGETDLALPGPLPFILSRTYSSYRTKTPAPVGVFGPGWKAPSDIRLQIRDDALVLNDNGGRSIHFEPLLPGEAVYSRSESMWLVRGGKAVQPDGHTLARLWASLPPDIRLSPHLYLATNSAQGPWWILGWSEGVPGAEDVLPAPLPPYRVLTGMADRFGRTLAYRCEAAGDLAGEITGVTDGAGREFRLVLTTQAQRAEEARKPHTASLSSPDSPRPLSAPSFPDTLPGTEYGADSGIRLSAVWLCTTRNTRKIYLPRHWCATTGRHAVSWRRCMTAAVRRCATLLTMINTGAGWWGTVMQAGRRCATATTMRGGWWSNLTRQA